MIKKWILWLAILSLTFGLAMADGPKKLQPAPAGDLTGITLDENANVCLGDGAGDGITSGTDNTNFGDGSGATITAGSKHTNVGSGAGGSMDAADSSVNLGYMAGASNTTGSLLFIGNDDDGGTKANTWIWGDGSYNVEIPNGNLDVTGSFSAVLSSFPVATFERTTTGTNAHAGTLLVELTTTNDMVDGFGPDLKFRITDPGLTHDIASVGAERDGADDSGKMFFSTYKDGVNGTKMTIDADGNVAIPTGNLSVSHTAFPAADLERTTTDTTGHKAVIKIKVTSSGNMADTFGPTVRFQTEDELGTERDIGAIGAERDGGDNYGKLFFNYYNNGDRITGMSIDSVGDVSIPQGNLTVVGDGTFSGKLIVTDTFHELADFTATTSDTTGTKAATYLKAYTSGDMADTFGVANYFQIEDAASGEQYIGHLTVKRDGADNSGQMILGVRNAGAAVNAITIDHIGDITLVNDLDVTTDMTVGNDLDVTTDMTVGNDLAVTADATAASFTGSRAAFPIGHFERTGTGTTGKMGVALMQATTSGDMADGFGPGVLFQIEDPGQSRTTIGNIYVQRDGADKSGVIAFNVYNAGVETPGMTINHSANVNIPNGTLTVAGNVTAEASLGVGVDLSITGDLLVSTNTVLAATVDMDNLASGATDAVIGGNLVGALCITDTGKVYIDTDGTCAN